jgi:hypothetical protein
MRHRHVVAPLCGSKDSSLNRTCCPAKETLCRVSKTAQDDLVVSFLCLWQILVLCNRVVLVRLLAARTDEDSDAVPLGAGDDLGELGVEADLGVTGGVGRVSESTGSWSKSGWLAFRCPP